MNDKSKKLLLAKRCHATGHSLLSDLGVLGKRNRADNRILCGENEEKFIPSSDAIVIPKQAAGMESKVAEGS
jgi:hypothetical protein